MLRALELSTQDLSSRFDEAEEDAGQVVPESTEVNNDDCDDNEECYDEEDNHDDGE